MDITTSNLDYSAFLSVKGLQLIDIKINHKGICYWTYQNDGETDLWMAFLTGEEVSAIKYAEALRACKHQAFSTKAREPKVMKRR